eukprot:scaffold301436_cov17-Prasinocladus_malaysianus.AAC.1
MAHDWHDCWDHSIHITRMNSRNDTTRTGTPCRWPDRLRVRVLIPVLPSREAYQSYSHWYEYLVHLTLAKAAGGHATLRYEYGVVATRSRCYSYRSSRYPYSYIIRAPLSSVQC